MANEFNDEQELQKVSERVWAQTAIQDSTRKEVLAATLRQLRARRITRTAVRLGAIAAVAYAAGLATIVAIPNGARVRTPVPTPVSVESHPQAPETSVLESVMVEGVIDPEALALALAEMRPENQIELLRRAGDWYLSQANDVESAVGCYQRMLDKMAPIDGSQVEDDSWLLLALKRARMQEKEDYDDQI